MSTVMPTVSPPQTYSFIFKAHILREVIPVHSAFSTNQLDPLEVEIDPDNRVRLTIFNVTRVAHTSLAELISVCRLSFDGIREKNQLSKFSEHVCYQSSRMKKSLFREILLPNACERLVFVAEEFQPGKDEPVNFLYRRLTRPEVEGQYCYYDHGNIDVCPNKIEDADISPLEPLDDE